MKTKIRVEINGKHPLIEEIIRESLKKAGLSFYAEGYDIKNDMRDICFDVTIPKTPMQYATLCFWGFPDKFKDKYNKSRRSAVCVHPKGSGYCKKCPKGYK